MSTFQRGGGAHGLTVRRLQSDTAPTLHKSTRTDPDMLIENGLVVFAKRACPTCTLIEPQMQRAVREARNFRVVSQDDPAFPGGVEVIDDRELDHSYLNEIEATPTLIRFESGREIERVVGWDRDAWEKLTGIQDLGAGLPAFQPG